MNDQLDLFGEHEVAPPRRYMPKPEHVRASLKELVEEMEAAERWPWPESVTRRYRDHWLEHLCSLLPDEAEAEGWRRRIARETARLDADGEDQECAGFTP